MFVRLCVVKAVLLYQKVVVRLRCHHFVGRFLWNDFSWRCWFVSSEGKFVVSEDRLL